MVFPSSCTNFVASFRETMANILNIETSTTVCSVSLSSDGEIVAHCENYDGLTHATLLSKFADEMLNTAKRKELQLDAIAVSIGPGSYTGLRIGLSQAKGLAFGLDLPLIGVNTLQLLAVTAMFQEYFEDDTLYVPMLDARRMEVYTAVYNSALDAIMEPQAMILDKDSYSSLLENRHLVMIGNGSQKAKDVIKHANASFMPNVKPVAVDMMALAEKAFKESRFIDVAYSTPLYLKDFQATVPKKKIF